MIDRASRSTVASLIASRAKVAPDRVAVIDDRPPSGSATEGRRRLTYGQLDDRAARLASVLAARGVAAGDRIALVSENRAEILELFVAAARLGAIVACQNTRLAKSEGQSELQGQVRLIEAINLSLIGRPHTISPRPFDAKPHSPRRVTKVGRNDPCPCGSGRKYKKCCLRHA